MNQLDQQNETKRRSPRQTTMVLGGISGIAKAKVWTITLSLPETAIFLGVTVARPDNIYVHKILVDNLEIVRKIGARYLESVRLREVGLVMRVEVERCPVETTQKFVVRRGRGRTRFVVEQVVVGNCTSRRRPITITARCSAIDSLCDPREPCSIDHANAQPGTS